MSPTPRERASPVEVAKRENGRPSYRFYPSAFRVGRLDLLVQEPQPVRDGVAVGEMAVTCFA